MDPISFVGCGSEVQSGEKARAGWQNAPGAR